MLLGFQHGHTAALGVTEDQRAIRLGRALNGTTMRSLAKHRDRTPPSMIECTPHLGGGGGIHPAFSTLHHDHNIREMVADDTTLFSSSTSHYLDAAGRVVAALLADELEVPNVNPRDLGGKGEEESTRKFYLGALAN